MCCQNSLSTCKLKAVALAIKDRAPSCHFQGWSVQFSSVAQSCPTLCDPMNCSTLGLPVHHQLPESTQTHVFWVSDAIQPSHPLLSPSPPAPIPPTIRVFSNESRMLDVLQKQHSSAHNGPCVLAGQLTPSAHSLLLFYLSQVPAVSLWYFQAQSIHWTILQQQWSSILMIFVSVSSWGISVNHMSWSKHDVEKW